MNKFKEIKQLINDLDYTQVSLFRMLLNEKIDSDIIKFYFTHKKNDGDVLELPEQCKIYDDLYILFSKYDKNTSKLKIKGFKVIPVNNDSEDETLYEPLYYSIKIVYEDNSSVPMGRRMKESLLDYIGNATTYEQNMMKAIKGCNFENQDIIITDPCYIFNYDKTDGYTDFTSYGLKENYICHSTLYGDWSCTTFDSDTNKPIGEFCADAGLVCVVPLDTAINANDGYENIKDNDWTRTIIRNFTGHVYADFKTEERVYAEDSPYHKKGEKYSYDYLEIVGEGNINFRTKQTGI